MSATNLISYPIGMGRGVTRALDTGIVGGASPARSVIVMLHGVGARADRWSDAMAALTEQHDRRAIALDLPGHGFATKGPTVATSASEMAERILSALDELGLQRYDLIGTSLGGLVAAKVALAVPERVDHLVLVGSLGLQPLGIERRRRLALTVQDRSREGITAKLRRLVVDTTLVNDRWIAEEVAINNSPGAAEFFATFANYLEQRLDDDLVIDQLVTLQTTHPLLLLWGNEDQTVPVELGRAAAAVLPGSSIAIMPSAAHAPYLEAPTEFAEIVDKYLRSP